MLLLTACAPKKEFIGVDIGSKGHSMLSYSEPATQEQCSNGGVVVSMFLDADDSLSLTEQDVFVNSYTVCNGLNGSDGVNGEDGEDGKTVVIPPKKCK